MIPLTLRFVRAEERFFVRFEEQHTPMSGGIWYSASLQAHCSVLLGPRTCLLTLGIFYEVDARLSRWSECDAISDSKASRVCRVETQVIEAQ